MADTRRVKDGGVRRVLALLLLFVAAETMAVAGSILLEDYSGKVASLIDPAKLATLDVRGANPRVEKYVALLAEANSRGIAAKKVARGAVALVGMRGAMAKLTVEAMARNLDIAERLGCIDADGLRAMHRGQAPMVRRGPYQGGELSVDHIIPLAVAPGLDKVIANLELMPLRMNEGKNAKIGARQLDLGRKLHKAGLLSAAGLRALEKAGS
jgi:hypothetical protein